MSEIETAAAAPSSTADIAASVIHEAEATDTSSAENIGYSETADTRLDTSNAVEETPAAKTEPTAKELSDAAKFLQKQGHQAKKVDGRDVWLPYNTVEKMLDRYAETHKTTWDGERTTLSSQTKELRDQIDTLRQSVAGDETAFLRELATIDPRYGRFLEQKIEQAQTPAALEMPGPDITLPDGSQTYSLKGLQSLLEWNTARVEGKLDEKLKPYAEREKADKARAEHSKAIEAVQTRTSQQLADAETWPGWADHKPEILAALQEDSAQAAAEKRKPSLSLEGAYRKVVVAKLLEDDTAKRARILKELNAAPKSSALSRQTTDSQRTPGVLTTQEITRRTVNKLESAS